MSMTELEVKVFKAAAKGCFCDPGLTVTEIAEDIGETVPTVKGVIGSLVKKKYIAMYEHDVNGEFFDVALPVLLNEEASMEWYTCDNFGEDEYFQIVEESLQSYL